MHTKHLQVTVEKAASDEFDARFVMSATSPDRVKDTIEEDAYAANLKRDLIALWQHDHNQPVGVWKNLRVEAGRLIGDLKVASTNLGLMIKQLIADGVPLGASIGFRGKGEPNKAGGIHFKEIELLECSVVSVPAHPRALQIAKSFGMDATSLGAQPEEGESAQDPAATLAKAKSAILAANRTLRKS